MVAVKVEKLSLQQINILEAKISAAKLKARNKAKAEIERLQREKDLLKSEIEADEAVHSSGIGKGGDDHTEKVFEESEEERLTSIFNSYITVEKSCRVS